MTPNLSTSTRSDNDSARNVGDAAARVAQRRNSYTLICSGQQTRDEPNPILSGLFLGGRDKADVKTSSARASCDKL